MNSVQAWVCAISSKPISSPSMPIWTRRKSFARIRSHTRPKSSHSVPRHLFDSGKAEDIPLQRMDQIVVGTQMRPPSVVFVEGEVRRPGYFTLETGEKLSSVLKRAGGFTATAFPEGIVLVRESVRKRQQVELNRFLAAERQRLTAQSAALAAGTVGMSTVGARRLGRRQNSRCSICASNSLRRWPLVWSWVAW